MTELAIIRSNAEMVIRKVGPPLSDLGERFWYNRASLEWVEGYIERLRGSGIFTEQKAAEKLASVFGSFLGECIARAYGGDWRNVDGEWGVYFSDGCAVFPFAKVTKQFQNGVEAGDSILGFFDMIPEVFLKSSREKNEQKG